MFGLKRNKKRIGLPKKAPEMTGKTKYNVVKHFSFNIVKKILIIKFYINETKYKVFIHLYNDDYIAFNKNDLTVLFEHNGYILNCNTDKLKNGKKLLRFAFNDESEHFYDLYYSVLPIKRKYYNDLINYKKK